MSIAETIKSRREARGMSQRALCAAAGLSDGYVNQIEQGTREPSRTVMRQLAAALGTTAAVLTVESLTDDDGIGADMRDAFVSRMSDCH